MATKIRNVELLTLARSDAGTPVLGHVGVGIDANLIQDFEMGLSRVSSAAQFNLALNTEGATTNTAHFGGIAFTQGASADTVMASIKAVNTSVDGYVDLSFNTRSVSNALVIKADGKVGIGTETGTVSSLLHIKQSSGGDSIMLDIESNNDGGIRFGRSGHGSLIYHRTTAKDFMGFVCNGSAQPTAPSDAQLPMMVINEDGKVGIGTGLSAPTAKLQVNDGSIRLNDSYAINWDGNNILLHDGTNTKIGDGSTSNAVTVAGGQVGIGVASFASSAGKLFVGGEIMTSSAIAQFDGFVRLKQAIYISDASTPANYVGWEIIGNSLVTSPGGSGTHKVGIGTGSTVLTELLEVSGNAKATKFIGALEGNADTVTTNANLTGDVTSVGNATSIAAGVIVNADVKSDAAIAYSKLGAIPTWDQDTTGNAATATALETARNIVVGKSVAGAGDIDAITQSFDGSANISFDSTLNSHLPADLRNTASTNIADEPGNTALKIIGSASKAVQLKINRQGLIVGFDEATITGDGGGGSSFDVTLHDEIYFNSAYNDQATKTIDSSTPAFNLHFNSEALFTKLKISDTLPDNVGDLEIEVGGTTKYLTLPDTSFTLLALSGNTLQVKVGETLLERDLDGLEVATATNATNAANVAITANAEDSTRYLTFVTGTSGDFPLLMDTGITYNPSSNTLATTNFVGALSGNATTSSGLLIGSTTYLPSSAADGGESLVLRNSSNEVSIAKLILSNNITASNLDVIVGKISGSDVLHEFSGNQVRALLGAERFLPAQETDGSYDITVKLAQEATSASNATTATRLVTTTNGVVKTINSNGTLSIGALGSGDIVDNDANTTGNAATATQAGGLTSGTDILPASFVGNSTNTIVARGTSGAISVGGVSCVSIAATSTITAEKIELTNDADSLQAKDIRPRGTTTAIPGATSGMGGAAFSSASVVGSTIGASNNAFDTMFMNRGYFWSGVILLSDQRVKENISQSNLGLNFVRLIEPVQYNMRASSTPRVYQGAIAQEVESALEELGANNSAITNIIDYDHDGTAEENEERTKALDNTQIMWVLFNAVKQLDAEVQDLKKQLEEK